MRQLWVDLPEERELHGFLNHERELPRCEIPLDLPGLIISHGFKRFSGMEAIFVVQGISAPVAEQADQTDVADEDEEDIRPCPLGGNNNTGTHLPSS